MKKVITAVTVVAAVVGVIAYKKNDKFKAYVDGKRTKLAGFLKKKGEKIVENVEEESSDSSSNVIEVTPGCDCEPDFHGECKVCDMYIVKEEK